MESSHYGYSELPASSYAAPPTAARYAYLPGSAGAPVHHADYQTYCVAPDRPRCTCGDRACAQFSVYDMGGRPPQSSAAQYYGHHVALPPGPPTVYPGHQMVYAGEHFPIIGPPPATHYHHHRHHYPSLSSAAAGAHFVPALYGNAPGAAPRQLMAAVAGGGENVSTSVTTRSTAIIAGESSAAQVKNVDAAVPAGDVSQGDADNGGESSTSARHGISTTSITTEHDITPTRDISASVSTSATTNSSQLHKYSSGELIIIVIINLMFNASLTLCFNLIQFRAAWPKYATDRLDQQRSELVIN